MHHTRLPLIITLGFLLSIAVLGALPLFQRTIDDDEGTRIGSLLTASEGRIPFGTIQTVEQMLTPTRDGLASVHVLVTGRSRASAAVVRLALADAQTGDVLRSKELAVRQLPERDYLLWRFEPVARSAQRLLRLTVSGLSSDATVWITQTDRYPGGALQVDGAMSTGDLLFEYGYRLPTVSAYVGELVRRITWLPRGVTPPVLTVLAVLTVALLAGLVWSATRLMLAQPDANDPSSPAPHV